MKLVEQPIIFGSEELILTNQSVIYWPGKSSLILSDLHLGKAAYFRKQGISVPVQVSMRDLSRLEFLISYYNAEEVIIVGDLIHAGANNEVELLKELTSNFSQTKFILIKGNHDRFSDEKLKFIGITEIYTELFYDSLHFTHQPGAVLHNTISGHIHPGVSIEFPTKSRVRFPCYVVAENEIILPAFSSFTGLDTYSVSSGAKLYAFYEDGIFMVTN